MDTESNEKQKLNLYLSPLGVWALALGCAVGWGAFVMPGTTFLPIAGPVGTFIGMAIGAVIMLIIGYNYYFMMNHFPNAGGTYAYAKKVLGYDHGFLSAWFVILVYIAITWANANALTIIFRSLLGDFFQFGFHYQIAGFDVYFGESLLSLAALWIFGAVCMRGGKFAVGIQIFMALILFFGVTFIFVNAAIHFDGNIFAMNPPFVPHENSFTAIIGIAVLAPWAFAGFESISNSTEEFNFSPKKSFVIISVAVIMAGMIYVFLTLLAISDMPKFYSGNWVAYINDLSNLSGFAGLPTLFATNKILGSSGIFLISCTIIAGVITGLIGNYIAASRLIFAVARDNILPAWFGKLNKFGSPQNAILFLMILSLAIPFMGHTAISWIVDINTIGATIAYTYTSIVALVVAREENNLKVKITGVIGTVISLIFFAYFMIPSFHSFSTMATESYLILITWSIFGFIFFKYILNKDDMQRFGKSTVVWMTILFLIFFTSMMWLREVTHGTTKQVLYNLDGYYSEELLEHGITLNEREHNDSENFIQEQMNFVNYSLAISNWMQMSLIVIALLIMFSVYNSIMKREREMEMQKIKAEQSNRAKSTFLSNMSHDIRTPMNAIVGYVTILKKNKTLPPETKDYLNKIGASSEHLLALINDVLDMSRIESGKMELEKADADLVKVVQDVYDMFATQMHAKNIEFILDTSTVKNRYVVCDKNRLNRVLLNLISNAYKFTPSEGTILISFIEKDFDEKDFGSYQIRIKDTGIGMSKEFAAKVFEAFEREKNSTVSGIQGTGLGMAITKSIVDLMGGTIRVETQQGKGSEFIIDIKFELAKNFVEEKTVEETLEEIDFNGVHLLLVDDVDVNREIATMLLESVGFVIDTAVDGKEAVEKVAKSQPKEYAAVLMDIQMPIMDGYQATNEIRNLKNPELAKIPIIAMTANAFSEDVQKAYDAGMDGHIAKPIDIPSMIETLTKVLQK